MNSARPRPAHTCTRTRTRSARRPGRARRLAWPRASLALALALVLAPGWLTPDAARADGPLGPDGSPITTSAYTVDFSHGPVLSSSRATGLAGAYTAIAEGAEGGLSNPAAVVNRYSASADWWDYWLAFGVTYPVANGDYFNSGGVLQGEQSVPESSLLFFNPGVYLQLDRLGFGLDMDIQRAKVTGRPVGSAETQVLNLLLVTNHVQLGWLFADGQLAVGTGLMVLRQVVTGGNEGELGDSLMNHTGFGAEFGLLARPTGKPWRFGAGVFSKARTRLDGGDATGDQVVGGYYLPRSGERPWQGNVAYAYQFGKRPLNPAFIFVDNYAAEFFREIDEREQAARIAHEARLATLGAAGRTADPQHAAALAHARQQWREQQAMFALERDAVRKRAWRELRERVRIGWSRRYLLVTAELSFTGRSSQAVGVESFLLQTVQRSGESVTVTPRVAAETEVLPTWMKLRAGMYLEPSRFSEGSPRLHGTLGLDLRVLHWDVFRVWPEDYLWQLSLAGDVTRDYGSLSLAINGWY